jgi:hypothetical protein
MSLIVHDLINASYYAAMNASQAVYSCPRHVRLLVQSENPGSVARKRGRLTP